MAVFDWRSLPVLGALDPIRSRLALAFGVTPETREQCLRLMLTGHRKDGLGDLFQLLISMGIATLGLVLGSAGVVIGAMLISPLMGPLVEVGMGLAVGSAVLVLRALSRTIISIVVVVGCAALLTTGLPFHEVTSEIASRTAPTVLDLFVAALCALMAGYTITRPASETTSTAAGTAIGIALVPPLCVVGWGIGTHRSDIAAGSALLFTANICAILLLTVLMFLLLAFERVDIATLEQDALATEARPNRIALALRSAFGSRYGTLIRWGTPVVLVCAVYVPLRRALREVAWQVRVRGQVTSIVDRLAPEGKSVRSSVAVTHHSVSVQVVLVADARRARILNDELRTQIAAAAGVIPAIDVVAVPDIKLVEQLERPLPALPPKPAEPDLTLPRRVVDELLDQIWPGAQAGPILRWTIRLESGADPTIEISHLGPPIGAAGCVLLADQISVALATHVKVVESDFVADAMAAGPKGTLYWWSAFFRSAQAAAQMDRLNICVEVPNKDAKGEIATRELALQALDPIPETRKHVVAGDEWRVQLSLDRCVVTNDGGISDGEADVGTLGVELDLQRSPAGRR